MFKCQEFVNPHFLYYYLGHFKLGNKLKYFLLSVSGTNPYYIH